VTVAGGGDAVGLFGVGCCFHDLCWSGWWMKVALIDAMLLVMLLLLF